MISTETSDETVSARSTSSCSEDYHEAESCNVGGGDDGGAGDGPKYNSITIVPLSLEKKASKNLRFSERRSFKKPKKLLTKTNLSTKTINTKIPRLSRENTQDNLEDKQNDNSLKKVNSPRYYIAIRKSYTSRKSVSQMNLKEAKHFKRNSNQTYNQMKITQNYNLLSSHCIQDDKKYEEAIEMNNSFYQIMRLNGNTIEEQMAGMKVFATVILNAWRRRRDEVKQLHEEIARIKKTSVKVKNQIHVLNSMFKIEQRQNEELNSRLRRMMDEQRKVQNLYDDVNNSHKNLVNKYEKLKMQIEVKERQVEGLEELLNQTKTELFKNMARGRDLECELSTEQRKVQDLENKKNELYDELRKLKDELFKKQKQIDVVNIEKNEQVDQLYKQFCSIEKRMEIIKGKDNYFQSLEKIESEQRKQIDELTEEINLLRYQINSTLLKRFKKYLYGDCSVPYAAFKIIHLITFHLLPAVPPPLKTDLPYFNILQKVGIKWG